VADVMQMRPAAAQDTARLLAAAPLRRCNTAHAALQVLLLLPISSCVLSMAQGVTAWVTQDTRLLMVCTQGWSLLRTCMSPDSVLVLVC
jgi:hypothetical protein